MQIKGIIPVSTHIAKGIIPTWFVSTHIAKGNI